MENVASHNLLFPHKAQVCPSHQGNIIHVDKISRKASHVHNLCFNCSTQDQIQSASRARKMKYYIIETAAIYALLLEMRDYAELFTYDYKNLKIEP